MADAVTERVRRYILDRLRLRAHRRPCGHEMVGPAGRVVGVDLNPAAVQRARAVASALELDNVEVVAGNLHELDPAALGGPFDLA